MAGTTSAVGIASNALILLGHQSISSFTDGSAGADVAAALYEETYHAILTETRWRFATKKAILARLSEEPLNGYQYKFQLPQDLLYLITPDVRDYEIYGSELHCNNREVSIDYIYKVPEDQLPAYFIKALEYNLAMQFAIPITGTTARAEEYRVMYEAQLKRARYADSSQRPSTPIPHAPYLEVRTY